MNAWSNPTTSTSERVSAKSASVSPGNPTMMSVVSAMSGIASRMRSTSAEVALARVGAPHRLQDPRRAGLHRQVELLAHRVALGHGLDHVGAHVLGMRAREPDAVDAVDRVERSRRRVAKLVSTAGRRSRPYELTFWPRSVSSRTPSAASRPASAHEVVGLAAVLAPAHRRHDAVRAVAVASGRDLHPCLERAVALQRQLARERVERREVASRHLSAGLDVVAQAVDVPRAERQVDERETGRRARPSSTPTSSRRRRSPCRGRGAWRRARPSGARRGDRRPSRGSCRC